jgi:FkbM family methyltransferase
MWLILNVVMDWSEFHFMRAYLQPSDTFFDVGANVGTYTLWASQFISEAGRIVAFEPDPTNHARFRTQLALNHLEWIRVEDLALYDSEGVLRFSREKDGLNHVVVDPTESERTIEIRSTTLDAYCEREGIAQVDFIKLDVEGAEASVLRGAQGMLSEGRLRVIQLECNQQALNHGAGGEVVLQILNKAGYHLFRFLVSGGRLERVRNVDWIGHENLFALRDLPCVYARLASLA